MNSLNSSRHGRVEVQYKGVWGTICGDSWDLRDADVVCRQLGYERALSAPRDTTFRYPTPGQNTGQIWLDEVNCEGNETSLSECRHLGWGAHDCRYYFNAGVVCRPTSKAMKHLIKIILKFFFLSFFTCFFESIVFKRITLWSTKANLRNGYYERSGYYFLIKF